ncbi:MAG: hypothetical protein V4469_03325 [Patescibacteria group bacterium]
MNLPPVQLVGIDRYLNIIGLTLSFLGSIAFAKGLFISQKEALRLGVSRWSGTDEENLKLPQVQDRLSQRKWGVIGGVLLLVGFILQLIVLI